MNIADFLKEERISLDLKAPDKKSAVEELAGLLKNAREISDFDRYLKDVYEREALQSTGIGNEVAIPHARTDAVKEFVIAFGKSANGVEFDSLDKKPARLVFLMGTQKKKGAGNYLQILAHLTRLLNKEGFRQALLKASTPKAVIDEFRKFEGI